MTAAPSDRFTLVPELARIMAAIPPLPEISADTIDQVRKRVTEASALQPRPDVHAVADRTVPGPAGPIPVRIYRPSAEESLPVLVFAHGGGWSICNIETHDGLSREITNRSGCIVVSVDYRLAPEDVFPAAAEDFYAAATWVAEHAAEIGGDPAHVAVGGDSAGGNLAAVVSLMARDRGGPRFAFQLLAYPGLDGLSQRPSATDNGEAPMLNRRSSQSMWRTYAGGADLRNPYLSPLYADDLTGLPPGLIVTAQWDMGVDDARAYSEAVTSAGGEMELLVVEGTVHGFLSYYSQVPACSDALDHACNALRATVGLSTAA